MGQIANQKLVEMIFKLKDRIKEKKELEKQSKQTSDKTKKE